MLLIFLLVVLGNPGSGCSTLLKTLANQRQEYHSVEGEVHYDSISPDELQKHFRGDVQYCPEDDIHFPTLSVEQTIKFAATTRTPHERAGISRDEFANTTTKILSTLLGLREVMTVLVGNAAIRAISGGEKKRVSIAEVLATRPCVGVWDKYNIYIFTVSAIHLLNVGIAPLAASIPVQHWNSSALSGLLPITWSQPPSFLFIRRESHYTSISTKYVLYTKVEWLTSGVQIKRSSTS